MAGVPSAGRNRGEFVLKAMQALVPNLHHDLVLVWDEIIPKLLGKLASRYRVCIVYTVHLLCIEYCLTGVMSVSGLNEEAEWNQRKWEELVLKVIILSSGLRWSFRFMLYS